MEREVKPTELAQAEVMKMVSLLLGRFPVGL